MKQFIILFAMILLGIFIYGLLMGDDEDSVKSSVTQVWRQQIEQQKLYP